MLGRCSAEHCTSGLQQIWTSHVKTLVDQEILLFGAESDLDFRWLLPELPHHPDRRLGQRLDGTQQRSLHIQRIAGERTEGRRNAESRAVLVALDKCRTRRIPCSVAAGLKCRTKSAGRKRGCIGLAADKVSARKLINRMGRSRGLQKGVVLFRRPAGQRLKPVGEMIRAFIESPALHPFSDRISYRRIKRFQATHRRQEFSRHRLRKIFSDRSFREHVLAVRLKCSINHIRTSFAHLKHKLTTSHDLGMLQDRTLERLPVQHHGLHVLAILRQAFGGDSKRVGA